MGEQTKTKNGITKREFLRAAALGLTGLSLAGPARRAGAAPAVVKASRDLAVGIGTDVVIMDTRIQQPDLAKSQAFHVMEPLFYPDNDGKMMGILLSAWEPLTNPPGWRFRVRPGVKFHNGEPFDAYSIKYTIDSILDTANKSWVHPDPRTRLATVQVVKVEDPLTALVLTKGFSRTFPLSTLPNPMLPPRYGADKGKLLGIQPVGTGHYKFVEYRSKSHLRLEANPDYHGHWDGPARNAGLTFRYLAENATRVAALEAGEVQVIDSFPPDAVERVKRNPKLDVLSTSTTRINGMNFHCGRPPFNNLKARLAVMHAIDREAIVKKILGGMADVATAPFPPGTLGVVGESFKPYSFDPKKAKQYFAEAGLSNGTKIKVGGPVGRYINDKQIVTAVAGMLAEVGFAPEIEQLEFGTYWPKVTKGYYDLFYAGWATRGYDPMDFQKTFTGFSEDNAGITHFVEHNKRVTDLYDRIDSTASLREAERSSRELAHLLWDNVPIANMFYEPNIAGISKSVKGWRPRRDTMVFMWSAQVER